MLTMDDITREELWRSGAIFALGFLTYPLIWSASDEKLPAVGIVIFPLVIALGTLPLRIWYRRRRYEV